MTLVNLGNIQVGSVHTDELLSQAAIEFTYPKLAYPKFVSYLPVGKQSDKYLIHNADEWNRDIETERGPGGEFNQVEFTMSEDTFYCNGHGLENGIPWEVIANADNWAADQITGATIAKRLKGLIDVKKERRTATFLTTSGNYASGFYENLDTVANRNFDDTSGPGALKLLMEFIDPIYTRTGGSKIVMGISSDAWRYLLDDANLQPSLTQNIVAQKAQVAETLEIDDIVVLRSQYNTADHGQAASRSNIWGSNKIILATVGGQGDMLPSTLREYRWTDALGRGDGDAFVDVIWDARFKNRYIQYGEYFDMKLTGVNSSDKIVTGVLLDNVYNAI